MQNTSSGNVLKVLIVNVPGALLRGGQCEPVPLFGVTPDPAAPQTSV